MSSPGRCIAGKLQDGSTYSALETLWVYCDHVPIDLVIRELRERLLLYHVLPTAMIGDDERSRSIRIVAAR